MSGVNDLADRVKNLEGQVAELQKAVEALLHNPNVPARFLTTSAASNQSALARP
jgi:hypothetical protein